MVCYHGLVVTAGAAFAQTDLMLHLLRKLYGAALVDARSRVLLLNERQAQAPFIVPEAFSNSDDLIGRLAARIEAALPSPPKIGELAQEFCMSERTLSRHVQKATGKSTLALVQSVKQRRARALLESSLREERKRIAPKGIATVSVHGPYSGAKAAALKNCRVNGVTFQ